MNTQDFIAFLRREADEAEAKARRLRTQAAALAAEGGFIAQDELAPLDELGRPKYTGKKRGRKPKPKKRMRKPGAKKRKHTGYTLYMKEQYPTVRATMIDANPDLHSKDVISSVASTWKEMAEEEKEAWRHRAKTIDEEDDDNGVASDIETGEVDGSLEAQIIAAGEVLEGDR